MNTLKIIPTSTSDIPTLLHFMEQFYTIDGYPFQEQQTRFALQAFFASGEHGKIFLLFDEAKPIGYVILAIVYSFEFGGRNAFLDEFYLDAPYRGKGIANSVMNFLIAEAQKMGIKALHLEVEQHNTSAVCLYEKFHFKKHRRFMMTRLIES